MADESVTTQQPETVDPPSKELWQKLSDAKAYTNSYEDFQKKYSTPESIDVLHQKLSEAKAYTNPKEDFYKKYFPASLTPIPHDPAIFPMAPKTPKEVQQEFEVSGKIPTVKDFNNSIPDYAKTNPAVSTNVSKPYMPDAAEGFKNRNAEMAKNNEKMLDEAVTNAAKRQLASKGVKTEEDKPLSVFEFARLNELKQKLKEQVANGDATVTIKNGEVGLNRTTGAWETFSKKFNEALDANDQNAAFANATDEERLKMLEEAPKTDPTYLGEQPNAAGSVTGFVGENGPLLAKGTAGAVLGGMMAAAAPETGGLSMVGAPTAMSFLFTADDAKNSGIRNNVTSRYQQLLKDNPNMSKLDAMAEARKGDLAGGTFGILENALLTGTAIKSKLSPGGQKVVEDAARKYVNTAVHAGASMAGVEGLRLGEEDLAGYHTTPTEKAKLISETFGNGATVATLLHGLTSIPNLPKVLKSAFKYNLKDVDPQVIAGVLQMNEKAGTIPPGTAEKVTNEIAQYKEAAAQGIGNMPPEVQASVAGLIEAKKKLVAVQATKDKAVKPFYDEKIAEIDQQIQKTIETGRPYDHEVDEISGTKYKKPAAETPTIQPIVVYHGTTQNFESFDPTKRGSTTHADDTQFGTFFSDSHAEANKYTKGNGRVIKAELNLKNPLVVDVQKIGGDKIPVIKKAIADGHDGIVFENIMTGKNKETGEWDKHTEYIVFDNNTIKILEHNHTNESGTPTGIPEPPPAKNIPDLAIQPITVYRSGKVNNDVVYTAETKDYADQFAKEKGKQGEADVKEMQIQPKNVLDLTDNYNNKTSPLAVQKVLEAKGVEFTEAEKQRIAALDENYSGDPTFSHIVNVPAFIDAAKRAGFDAIKQKETTVADEYGSMSDKPKDLHTSYAVIDPAIIMDKESRVAAQAEAVKKQYLSDKEKEVGYQNFSNDNAKYQKEANKAKDDFIAENNPKEVSIPIEEKSKKGGFEFENKTFDELEQRQSDLEDEMVANKDWQKNEPLEKEHSAIDKELEKRERDSVFSVPLEEVKNVIDWLIKKEKERPGVGYGTYIEMRDARETKSVAEKYLNPKEITDGELKQDFKDAVLGNPSTWYADGMKLRESMKEASNRGIDIKEMIAKIENQYIKDGYSAKDAHETVARKLKPIFEGSQKVETSESKLLSENKPINKEAPAPKPKVPAKPKEKGLMQKAKDIEDITNPRDKVLQYFASGGKIHSSSIEQLYGGKNKNLRQNVSFEQEKRARIGLLKKDGPGIDELAHKMWEEANQHLDVDHKINERDFKEAIEQVLQDHVSPGGMAKELVNKYSKHEAEKDLTEAESELVGNEMLEAVQKEAEKIPAAIQTELVTLLDKYNDQGKIDWIKMEEDSNGFDPDMMNLSPEAASYLDNLIKNKLYGRAKAEYLAGENDGSANDEGQGSAGQAADKGNKAPQAEENAGVAAEGRGQGDVQGKVTEADVKQLQAAYDKAVKAHSDAQSKLAGKDVQQANLPLDNRLAADNTQQAALFKAGDNANDVLTPLKENVKAAWRDLDAAKKKLEAEADNENPDIFEPAAQKHYEEVAGSKPNKATGRIAVDPIIGEKPKQLSDILRDFTSDVKQKVFYSKVKRNAAGTYTPSNAAIKLRYSGDLDTTAHEFGHKLDDVHNIVDAIENNPAAKRELPYFMKSPAASKPPKGHPDPKRYQKAEGVAEWVRAYIVNPKQAIYEAPEIHKIYTSLVDQKIQEAVNRLSVDVRTWAGASGRDMVLSNIEFKPDEAHGLWKTLFGDKKDTGKFNVSFADKIAANFLQPMQAFNKAFAFAKGIKGVDEVLPSEDPVLLSRLLLGFDGKFGQILDHGMLDSKNNILTAEGGIVVRDQDGKILKDGTRKNLAWLIGSFDNTDMGSVERDIKDTVAYMVAERTVELSKRFGRANAISGIGGGMFKDIDIAKKALDEFTNGDQKRLARIQEGADRYREFADDVLKYMVDKGRMNKDQYKVIKDNNLQYVAMNRILESEPGTEIEPFSPSGGGSIGSAKKVDYKIKGSARQISNPYTSLLETTYRSIREADRNEVLLAFRDMIHAPRGMNDGPVKEFADIGVLGKEGDKNTVKIFVNGKAENWLFHPEIYKALKGIDGDIYKLPGFLKMPAQLLRFTVTHFPTFAARNVVRDTQDRIIKSTTGSGFKDMIGNKEHWNDVARAGGLNAGFYYKDRTHYYGLLEQSMDDIAKNKKFILADPIRLKELWHGYENMLYNSETVNRVAEYRGGLRKAKELGMDDYNASLYAAFKARDLIDFAVAGHTMKLINQIIPFTNAGVQGIRSSAVSLAKNPAAFLARTMMYSVLPGAALWYLNHRDKETAEEYENLPAYQKDLYWNYKLGDNVWLAVPKPYELSIGGAGVDRAMSAVFNKNDNAFKGYGGTVAKSFMPVDESSIFGPFRPIIENITNYDSFRDKNIIPPHEDKLNLALRNTGTASRIGQLVQKAAGIDARKVDHFVRSQFSYIGNFAIKASDIGRDDGKEQFDLTDLGFFKNTPAYNAPPVQELLKYAKEWNLERSKDYKEFSDEASAYFDLKTNTEKEAASKLLIDHAKALMVKWKQDNKADSQVEKKERKDLKAKK